MNAEENFKTPVVLFYSYSHKDETYREELEKHLKTLWRSGLISDWHDRKILAGDEWDKKISEYLEKSYVILLLISSDFIASEYCYDIEAARALERYNKGEAILIPIILRPVKWDITPFGKIQALPKNAQPVTQWTNRDSAYLNICEGILALLTSTKSESKDTSFEPIKNLTREKVLDAALPEQIAVGKTIALVVLIRGKDSEGLRKILRINTHYGVNEEDVISTGTFPLEFSVDESGKPLPLDLNIKIESPDFDIPTQTKSIKILPDGDSEPRIFLLTPKTTGDLIVNLELYSGDDFISGCFLKTKVSQTALQNVTTNLITVPINPDYFLNQNIHTTNASADTRNFDTQSYDPAMPLSRNSSILKLTTVAAFSILFVLAGTSLLYLRSSDVYEANSSPNVNRSIKITSDNFEFPIPSLRTIQSAQKKYFLVNKSRSYGTLEQLKNAGLIDETLASGESNGYKFTVSIFKLNNQPAFGVTVSPLNPKAGKRSFYMNEQGEIYYTEGNN